MLDIKVLIVEDSNSIQKTAQHIFEALGIPTENIVIVNNGLEAVELIESGEDCFQLIYMDIEMPVMKGPDAILRIRAYERAREATPAAQNSSFFRSYIFICSSEKHYEIEGADEFIHKPVTKALIEPIVHEVRERYSAHCESTNRNARRPVLSPIIASASTSAKHSPTSPGSPTSPSNFMFLSQREKGSAENLASTAAIADEHENSGGEMGNRC